MEWDGQSAGVYQTGLDRGVLYPRNGAGVAWNGLSKVEERKTGGKLTPTYYEGGRYDIEAAPYEMGARIGAYTYPDELDELVGYVRDSYGILYGEQEPDYFSLSYRTRITDGYQIHVLLNQKAIPVDVTRNTTTDTPSPIEFLWDTQGVPDHGLTVPTSYVVLDSRHIPREIMRVLEIALYGSEDSDPSMSNFLWLLRNIVYSEEEFVIVDSNASEWTILGPEDKIHIRNQEFEIQDIDHEYIAEGEYRLYDRKEER